MAGTWAQCWKLKKTGLEGEFNQKNWGNAGAEGGVGRRDPCWDAASGEKREKKCSKKWMSRMWRKLATKRKWASRFGDLRAAFLR